MSDAVVIDTKKTQELLGEYVKKPPLTDKLLQRPPVRFLHDVILAMIKQTGFFDGLYSANELDWEKIKDDREAKVAFLQKAIDATQFVIERPLDMRPLKAIAGQEPELTNAFLQSFAIGYRDNRSAGPNAVQRVLQGEKPSFEKASTNNSAGSNKENSDSKKTTTTMTKEKSSTNTKIEKSSSSKEKSSSSKERKSKREKEGHTTTTTRRGSTDAKSEKKSTEKESKPKEGEHSSKKRRDSSKTAAQENDVSSKHKKEEKIGEDGSAATTSKAQKEEKTTKSSSKAKSEKEKSTSKERDKEKSKEKKSKEKEASSSNKHDSHSQERAKSAARSKSKSKDQNHIEEEQPAENKTALIANGSVRTGRRESEIKTAKTIVESKKADYIENKTIKNDDKSPDSNRDDGNSGIRPARPGTAIRTAVVRPGTAMGQRPGTAMGQRPGTAMGQRPGTAMGQRPGTAMGERPGSAIGNRPGTALARPAPPRIKKRTEIISAEEQQTRQPSSAHSREDSAKMTQNVISESEQQNKRLESANKSGKPTAEEDYGGFIVEEHDGLSDFSKLTDGLRMGSSTNEIPTDANELNNDEHGGLVRKILETKKDLESNLEKAEENEERKHVTTTVFDEKERERTKRDMDQLQASIQLLTRASYPLGRVLDFVQEDVDAMLSELNAWRAEFRQNTALIRAQQSSMGSEIEPLKAKLAEVERQIADNQEQIGQVKASILESNTKARQLIMSVVKK